jgi:hypothetical protein
MHLTSIFASVYSQQWRQLSLSLTELSMDEISKCETLLGKVRGAVFQTDGEYIKRKYNSDQLAHLEHVLKEVGHPMEYDSIRAMDWYPLKQRVISFLCMQEYFHWDDNEFRNMGSEAPKFSFIAKLLMKFFVSPQIAFNHAPEYWTDHYDTGVLKAETFNAHERFAVVTLKDFTTHTLYCRYLEGYFRRLFMIMFPEHEVTLKETHCPFKGDKYHIFRAEWTTHHEVGI